MLKTTKKGVNGDGVGISVFHEKETLDQNVHLQVKCRFKFLVKIWLIDNLFATNVVDVKILLYITGLLIGKRYKGRSYKRNLGSM